MLFGYRSSFMARNVNLGKNRLAAVQLTLLSDDHERNTGGSCGELLDIHHNPIKMMEFRNKHTEKPVKVSESID